MDPGGDPGPRIQISAHGFAQQSIEIFGRPRGELAAQLDGFGILCHADEIEGEVTDHRHVACTEAFAQPRLVLVEGDIENPVQAVLDPPVTAYGRTGLFRGQDG